MSATSAPTQSKPFQGNDKLLFGIVLGVITFWLFAGTAGTVAPSILLDIIHPSGLACDLHDLDRDLDHLHPDDARNPGEQGAAGPDQDLQV